MQKQYDSAASSATLRALWSSESVYAFPARASGPTFIIDTPPPTVSGSLHIGHIFSYTHQDIIARHRRMSGYRVMYPFGFDDNGLPTERFVEKKRNIHALGIGRSAFIKEIIEETALAQQDFQQLWERLGLSVDWSARYSTIDDRTRRISQLSFVKLYEQADVYRSLRPAPYCPVCCTSVAQAELEDAVKPSVFVDLRFEGVAGQGITIATTRPEFLGSCVAVMVHPDDPRYRDAVGTYVRVPLYGYEVPVLADDAVKIDKGTGAVMCCAFGDTTDIAWIAQHGLAYRQILQPNGRFIGDVAYIGGLKVKAAREAIMAELKQQGLVLAAKPLEHVVQVHERCKNEIEYLYLKQWFVALVKHKEALRKAIDDVAWHPDYMRVRCVEWVDNLVWDWCISRQRFYGIPFPCWHCVSCGHVIMASAEQLPLDPQEVPYEGPCPACGETEIVPDTDVMDTWNTSSLTPYIVQELVRERDPQVGDLPLAMRPQAHDIIRTWAFYTIAKTWLHDRTMPWRDLVISGHVLSAAHQKISKSQGNSPLEPDRLLQSYQADAVRYWAGSAHLGADTAFSENQLKIGHKLVTKLWNAGIFVHEYGHAQGYVDDPRDPLNAWVVQQLHETQQGYHVALQRYDFHKALSLVDDLFWRVWCDNYLELIKDRFFNPDRYDEGHVAETRAVLYRVGYALLQMYAPYLPFVTDALYQEIYRHALGGMPSLHSTTYLATPAVADPVTVTTIADTLLVVVDQVRKLKSEAQLSLKTEVAVLEVIASAAHRRALEAVLSTLAGVARAQRIIFSELPAADESMIVLDGPQGIVLRVVLA